MVTAFCTLDPKDACDVFLSHAGEDKRNFVDPIHQILESEGGVKGKRQRVIKVFMDQHSLQIGDTQTPWTVMEFEAKNCRIAVVVVSQAYVRKEYPMKELQIFLDRQEKDPKSIRIIPVFVGLTVEECYEPKESLYNKMRPWPEGVEEPSEEQKAEWFPVWTAAVQRLPKITILRDEMHPHDGALPGVVADWVVEHLIDMRRLPESFRRCKVVDMSRVMLSHPSSLKVVGRNEEVQRVMKALTEDAGAAVLLGGPGLGKSTVAVEAGLELCKRGWFPGGAFVIDFLDFPAGGDVRAAAAGQLITQLQRCEGMALPAGSSWAAVEQWLSRRDALGEMLLLFENAEGVLRHEECTEELWRMWKALLKMNLRGERSVRLVVNSRVALGGGLGGADQVHLAPLHVADAEELLLMHCGKEVQGEEVKATQLAQRVCGCHPYALTLVGGLLAARRLLNPKEAVERRERYGSIKQVALPPPRPSQQREDAESRKQGEWLACVDSLAADAAEAEAAALAAPSAVSAPAPSGAAVSAPAASVSAESVVPSGAAATRPWGRSAQRPSSNGEPAWRTWLKMSAVKGGGASA